MGNFMPELKRLLQGPVPPSPNRRKLNGMNQGMPRRLGIGLLLLAFSSAPSSMGATMSKCQTADGRITYTDQPCSTGAVTQKRIEPDAAPAAPPAPQPSRAVVVDPPYKRPSPVVVPPVPPAADLSKLPKDAQGRPIISQSRNYAIVVDDDAKLRPVNVLAACSELVTRCVSPRERTLDACFMSVPQCPSAQPWNDPAYKPCCPAQCWAQYEERRIAGMAPIAAFRATLYGTQDDRGAGCIPIR